MTSLFRNKTRLLSGLLAFLFTFGMIFASPYTLLAAPEESSSVADETKDNENSTENTEPVIKYNWPDAPELYSEIAILIDADTGAILYEKNAHIRAYPASTTKLLTGLLTVENCNLNEVAYTSHAAAHSVTYEDSSIGAKNGEEFTIEQCLYALLVHSANEIAYVLAEHVAGDLASFVMMMNMRAEELGCLNTHFNNASGLHSKNHYTTAYDLAMIGRGCLNNATFVQFDSHPGYYIMGPTNKTSVNRTLIQRNEMLKGGDYYYEYCKGGKTGFTDEALYTLVTFAEKNDTRLISVVLRSGKKQRFEDCTKLFEYGFNNFSKNTPNDSDISSIFGKSNFYQSDVWGGNIPAFHLSTTTMQLPKNVAPSAVKLVKNANVTSDSSYQSHVNYVYNDGLNDHVVGTATITLGNYREESDLPYLTAPSDTSIPRKLRPTVNVWLIIGGIIVVVGIYCGRNAILNYLDLGHRKRRARKRI